MSNEVVQSFFRQLAGDPELQAEVGRLSDQIDGVSYLRASQLCDAASRHGFNFTRDELLSQCSPSAGELSRGELESVVGGGLRVDDMGMHTFRVEIDGVAAGQLKTTQSLLLLNS